MCPGPQAPSSTAGLCFLRHYKLLHSPTALQKPQFAVSSFSERFTRKPPGLNSTDLAQIAQKFALRSLHRFSRASSSSAACFCRAEQQHSSCAAGTASARTQHSPTGPRVLLLLSDSEEEGAGCSELQGALPELHAAPRLTFSILTLSLCTLQLLFKNPPPALTLEDTHRAGSRFPRPLGSCLCPHEVTRPSPGDAMLSGSRGLWDMGGQRNCGWEASLTPSSSGAQHLFLRVARAVPENPTTPSGAGRGPRLPGAVLGTGPAPGRVSGCNGEAEGVMLQVPTTSGARDARGC